MFLIARRADMVSADTVVDGKISSSVWVGVGLWLIKLKNESFYFSFWKCKVDEEPDLKASGF